MSNYTLTKGPKNTSMFIGLIQTFSGGACNRDIVAGPTTDSHGGAKGGFTLALQSGVVSYELDLTDGSTFWTTKSISSTLKSTVPMVHTSDLPCAGPVGPTSGFGKVTYEQTGQTVVSNYALTKGPKNTSMFIGLIQTFSDNSCNRDIVAGPTTDSHGGAKGSFTLALQSGVVSYELDLTDGSTFWTTKSISST